MTRAFHLSSLFKPLSSLTLMEKTVLKTLLENLSVYVYKDQSGITEKH